MTENTTPIENRAANIKERVSSIIDAAYERMFEQFDDLHKRNIHDNDIVEALTQLRELDILDGYANWAEIDLRTDDNTTTNPTVPDGTDRNRRLAETLRELRTGITELQLATLREILPLGTPVEYTPSDPSRGRVQAMTTSRVGVTAGVPVVSLSDGTKAAAVTALKVDA